MMASEKRTTTRRKAGSNSRSGLSKSAAASPIDLGSTQHGVTYPKFDANQYVATDLFSDSSAAPRMSKAEADEAIAGIEERQNALDVATANLELNTKAVKAATKHTAFEGELIGYATARVANETKLIGYQSAEISRDTASINRDTLGLKRDIAAQKHEQEKLTLSGETNRTQHLIAKWERDKAVLDQEIQSLDLQIQEGRQRLGLSSRRLNVVDAKAS